MNKELIKKYKKEFDWWLNGGKLMVADLSEDEWNWLPLEPSWKNTNSVYVIDDDYLLLREALAEGKTIQYLPKDSNKWQDCIGTSSASREFPAQSSRYRIKPEEPKFKEGEWVLCGMNKDDNCTILKQYKKFSIPKDMEMNNEWKYQYIMTDDTEWAKCKKWEPKEDEWHLFWNTHYTTPVLEQFDCIAKSIELNKHVYKIKNYEDRWYEYCAPYGVDINKVLRSMK